MFKYTFEDMHVEASGQCLAMSNYSRSYSLDGHAADGQCTEDSYQAAEEEFSQEKKNRDHTSHEWERSMLYSVAGYGFQLLVVIMFSVASARRGKNSSTCWTVNAMVKHNTYASILCSLVMFAFGVCILAISLGYFLRLSDSTIYNYCFVLTGLLAIHASMSTLTSIPEKTASVLRLKRHQSSFGSSLAPFLVPLFKLRNQYLEKFGVAGSWFISAAILKEIIELMIQIRALVVTRRLKTCSSPLLLLLQFFSTA